MPGDGFSPSESIGNYTEIREAANLLSRYVSFTTKDKLDLITSIASTRDVNQDPTQDKSLFELAGKMELIVGSTEGTPLYEAADKLLKGQQKPLRYDKFTPGAGSILNSKAGAAGGFISVSNTSKTPVPRVVSVFNHAASERINISSSLSDISAMFCALVPPVEMSLCVPYFNVKIIYPRESDGQGSLSLIRYVGVKPEIKQGKTGEKKIINETLGRGYEDPLINKIGYDVAGMEIFTVPQTLGPKSSTINSDDEIAARGVTILDTNSPLMTLESASIQQTGIGGSLYAQTKVELKLTLHDRSRLGEIETLVSAQAFPTVSFRITYGWQHPHGNKMSGNVYAKLINAMKVTQDFVVSSVSLSSRDSASMSISLSLVSAGNYVAKSAKILTSLGELVPYSVLQPLIKQVVNFRTDKNGKEPFKAVGTSIVTNTSPAASSNKFIRVDKFYEFKKMLDEQTQLVGEKDSYKIEKIVKALTDIETNGVVTADSSAYGELFVFPSTDYGLYMPKNIRPAPTYAARMNKLAPSSLTETSKSSSVPGAIPMSAAISKYVALPLLLSQPDIDEVRVHFYSFNETAGYQAASCIGDFPIILRDLIATRDPKSNKLTDYIDGRTSVEKVMSMIVAQASTPTSPFYGLTTHLDKQAEAAKQTDTAVQSAASDEQRKEKQAEAKILQDKLKSDTDKRNREILRELGIKTLSDTAFVPPRVKTHMEVVPAYLNDDEKSTVPRRLLRIHVYDERAAGIGNKANFLVSLMNNATGVGAVNSDMEVSPAMSELLDNLTERSDGQIKYYALKDKVTARKFISDSYPTFVIGADTGMITSTTFNSQPAGDVASSYLLSALEGGSTGNSSGASVTNDLIDDVNIIPTTVTMNMIGNICMARGQTYFIDFNTGTTLDNTYTVTSVSHSIKPGGFTTSVTFAPVASASMKSALRQITEIKKLLIKPPASTAQTKTGEAFLDKQRRGHSIGRTSTTGV